MGEPEITRGECQHRHEPTGLGTSASGRTYLHLKELTYCPLCRTWFARIVTFVDGRFYKTDEAAAEANRVAQEASKGEREAWVRDHYPHHVAAVEETDGR